MTPATSAAIAMITTPIGLASIAASSSHWAADQASVAARIAICAVFTATNWMALQAAAAPALVQEAASSAADTAPDLAADATAASFGPISASPDKPLDPAPASALATDTPAFPAVTLSFPNSTAV